eukprot:6211097-Pleurochrysis_carterae.AAC.2
MVAGELERWLLYSILYLQMVEALGHNSRRNSRIAQNSLRRPQIGFRKDALKNSHRLDAKFTLREASENAAISSSSPHQQWSTRKDRAATCKRPNAYEKEGGAWRPLRRG